jgi:hypothetical protein
MSDAKESNARAQSLYEIAFRKIHTAESKGREFSELLEVARLFRAYMMWEGGRDKVPISKGLAGMAASLIGIKLGLNRKTGKIAWRLAGRDVKRHERRMRSAGIDPWTWKIFDSKRAAWAWWQLKQDKHYYSEARQERLMRGEEEPPDINIPLKYSQELIKIQRALVEGVTNKYKLPAKINAEIRERLGNNI